MQCYLRRQSAAVAPVAAGLEQRHVGQLVNGKFRECVLTSGDVSDQEVERALGCRVGRGMVASAVGAAVAVPTEDSRSQSVPIEALRRRKTKCLSCGRQPYSRVSEVGGVPMMALSESPQGCLVRLPTRVRVSG